MQGYLYIGGHQALPTSVVKSSGSIDESKIIVKSTIIPEASEENVGFVYQYAGESNATYTHGYIYECKAIVENNLTSYAWERIDVQPSASYQQEQADWNQADTTAVDYIKNKPSLATVATSGLYSDLSGTPTIPTVNDATLTITQGGVSKGTFTANAGTDVTIALDSGASIDNTTITENASNQLQASAVMNARTGTDVLPIWQGTQQQWTEGVGTDWYNWRTDITPISTNFTNVNNVIINDYIASGFYINNTYYSNNKYLLGTGTFSPQQNDTWEVKVKAKTGNTHNGYESVFESIYDEDCGIYVGFGEYGKFNAAVSSDGANWDIMSFYSTEVSATNTDYWLKLGYDGSKYYFQVSTDGTTFTTLTEVASSTKVYSNLTNIIIGIRNKTSTATQSYFYGSVYLDEVECKINGSVAWSPYTFDFHECYTLSTTPETTDTVYSAPNTASALTITSVGTGTITLSDNNTYTYTQSGDEVTYQSIGEAHPTWLCNINGVGVKVGTTVIADNTDTSTLQTKANLVTSVDSSSTDSQYPSAKLFYDTCGDIETLINNL